MSSSPYALEILARLRDQGVTPSSITADSRKLAHGDVFAAWPGFATDGRKFIPAAVANGAAAVVWECGDGFVADPLPQPSIGVESLRHVAGHLAHEIFGRPSAALWTVGVTGTNGKTTVTQWLARALADLGLPCGVIGTLGNGFPGQLSDPVNTTPDALELHRFLADFRAQGATAAVMEVSSIGLEQGRVNGVLFDVAVFTNLSRDHLDYHGDMARYGAAKAALFQQPGLAHAVVNVDDSFGLALAGRLVGGGLDVIACSCVPGSSSTIAGARMLVAHDLRMVPAGLKFALAWQGERVDVQAKLVAEFNVSNLLSVIGALLARDVPLADVARVIARLTPPAGRMQLIGGIGEPLVIVDYAHSPDALAKVLEAARPTAVARGGRLACVFGCGGDRDRGKRPLMGEIAARLADRVIVTSDNPRSEEPLAIIGDIVQAAGCAAETIPDRAAAIRTAIVEAGADDVVVLAGKGHEPYQEVCGRRHPFSDGEEAARSLLAWQTREDAPR
ncbi:MAG TPA: UDP-N-acetylmuramoyl-L-alanyl-D-glutamate--2,6-diaminopimelate ligase [Rhodocyclaceae bacterium]|nr:UDP-N-acetylmuramoyl-L-alanyl-D-glutamate--2,6-diaminopimelate ligase [Rhodocyclaceae bacterium]